MTLPREKQYESAAERQRAYRARKLTTFSPIPQTSMRKENMTQETIRPNTEIAADVVQAATLVPVAEPLPEKRATTTGQGFPLSPIVASGGESAARRFLEFFTVTIRNAHTRRAYYRAASSFLDFCEEHGVSELPSIQPMMVAAFIETRCQEKTAPTVKQELAAIRQLFDYLVTGHIVDVNPAAAVKGPRYSIAVGKTPVLTRDQAKKLLEGIPITYKVKKGGGEDEELPDLLGLRDRALIGLMVFSFARVGAVTKVKVGDYYQSGKRWKVRLHEKGGKFHELPVHHKAEEYLDAYLDIAEIRDEKKTPLFRTCPRRGREISERGMTPSDVLYMVKRRALEAGLPPSICCHTFRATGITAYLEGGGTVENAQAIANHADSRTTKLYDRRGDRITLDEIEKIQL
jgi:site-specific recombinase XerD